MSVITSYSIHYTKLYDDYQQLSTTGIQSESDLVNLINLVSSLSGLDEPGNAITADVNGGLGIRVGHFGVGARAYAQAVITSYSIHYTKLYENNALAVDTVALSLLGLSESQVWTQRVARKTNRPFSQLEEIDIFGVLPEQLRPEHFRPAKVTDIHFGLV